MQPEFIAPDQNQMDTFVKQGKIVQFGNYNCMQPRHITLLDANEATVNNNDSQTIPQLKGYVGYHAPYIMENKGYFYPYPSNNLHSQPKHICRMQPTLLQQRSAATCTTNNIDNNTNQITHTNISNTDKNDVVMVNANNFDVSETTHQKDVDMDQQPSFESVVKRQPSLSHNKFKKMRTIQRPKAFIACKL